VQVQARLEGLEHLKGLQAAERDRTQELLELIRAHAEENV
jgi:hypothetical protein